MTRGRAQGAALVAALVFAVTACGGGDGDGGSGDGDGGAAADGGGGGGEAATAEQVALDTTAQETTWTPLRGLPQPVEVAPVSLARGDIADLENIRLDDELAALVPYYLTYRYTNTGDAPLSEPNLSDRLDVNGADGQSAERLTLFGGGFGGESPLPSACDKAAPERLEVGEEAEVCRIYLLPEERQPASVAYVDEGSTPLVWQVEGAEGEAGLLPLGEAVETSWEDVDENAVPVRVTPVEVVEGTMDDLRDWDVDREGEVPHYVHVEYVNGGEENLYPNMQDGVELRTASGQVATRLSLIDVYGRGVDGCPSRVPDEMVPPEGTVTMCAIHMAAEGDPPHTLVFQPRGTTTEPVTWQVTEQAEQS